MSRMCFHWMVLAGILIGFSACSGSCGSSQTAPVVTLPPSEDGGDAAADTAKAPTATGEIRFEGKLSPPLGLTVIVLGEGYLLETKSGLVGRDCLRLDPGTALTIPLKDDAAFDTEALRECARRLKRARMEFAGEDAVIIQAAKDTDYKTVVEAIDALRGTDTDPLFREVSLRPVK